MYKYMLKYIFSSAWAITALMTHRFSSLPGFHEGISMQALTFEPSGSPNDSVQNELIKALRCEDPSANSQSASIASALARGLSENNGRGESANNQPLYKKVVQ